MQLTALRKKAEGSAPPERKPGRRLTVRRGAAQLLVLALAVGAALGGKALFFSGEEQTPLTEQTTYGRRGRGRPALKSAARRRRSASRTGRTASP